MHIKYSPVPAAVINITLRLGNFRPIGFPRFAVAVINWKHQEDVQRCFFSSGRTGYLQASLGDREARDAASSSWRIRRKISLQTSSVPFQHWLVFPVCYWSQTSGASATPFSKIIPSKSCQSGWRSVSCHQAGADIDLVGGKRHHTPIFSPSADVSTIDFAAVSCDRRTNDSKLIKSASTQKHAVKILVTVFHQLGCEWFYFISFFMN